MKGTKKQQRDSLAAQSMVKSIEKYKTFKEEVHLIPYLAVMLDDCICKVERTFDGVVDKGVKDAIRKTVKESDRLVDKIMKERSFFPNNDAYLNLTQVAFDIKDYLSLVVNYGEPAYLHKLTAGIDKHFNDSKKAKIIENIKKEIKELYDIEAE